MENLTLTGLLRKAATAFPSRRAISVSRKFDVTYSRLQELVEHAASLLVAQGVKPSDVVALVFPNTLEYVVMFLAVIQCRATAAPLNSAYTVEEFEFYLSDSESKLLIVPQEGIQSAKAAASKLNIPHVTATLPDSNFKITISSSSSSSSSTESKSNNTDSIAQLINDSSDV